MIARPFLARLGRAGGMGLALVACAALAQAQQQSTSSTTTSTTSSASGQGGGASGSGPGESGALTGATSSAVLQDEGRLSRQSTTLLQDERAGYRVPPFGSEMFQTIPAQVTGAILDPGYIMKPGDKVSVTMWGLVNSSSDSTVDPKGNVVVPGVGPIPIAGAEASQVDDKIRAAASNVYRDTVQVYASPLNAVAMQVFVTGAVNRPGSITGNGAESMVTYLQRAGGPNVDRGSYRNIVIKRGNRAIGKLDLYAFLLNGELPPIHLREGDAIVVGEQGPIVSVTGDVRAPYTFEFASRAATGAELLRYARPRPGVTHVAVLGTRGDKPVNRYLTLAEFGREPLSDGDRVRFETDSRADTYVIHVEGAFDGPSSYTVPRGATLGQVLSQVRLDPLADPAVIHLQRVSIAETQKQLLEESLSRLEKVIYTTPSPTPTVAQARAVDSAGLSQFIARARAVQPAGLVALPAGVDRNTVLLEPDDTVVIPFRSQVVTVGGEVNLPQALIFNGRGSDAKDYVKKAGGFSARGNRSQVLVIRQDGSAHIGGQVMPGDRVLVPPKVSSSTFDLVKDITQILYQIGIAAATVLRL